MNMYCAFVNSFILTYLFECHTRLFTLGLTLMTGSQPVLLAFIDSGFFYSDF